MIQPKTSMRSTQILTVACARYGLAAPLVGLDRDAAKRAFVEFLDGRRLTGDQLRFVDEIINHLTACGVMDPKLLYEASLISIALELRAFLRKRMWFN